MARFDVRPLRAAPEVLVVDVQADILSGLNTRVVIPLRLLGTVTNEGNPPLNPIARVASCDYVLMTADIGTVPIRHLGEPVANLEAGYRDTIIRALDFLFEGF